MGSISPDDANHWVSVHVYTTTPLDTVISELLPGLLSELRGRGLVDSWFFLRHWAAGPHLRVRLRLAESQHEEEARALLSDHLTALYSKLPPSQPMPEQDYLELARRLAVWEPDVEVGSLAPNDSHAFIPYHPEHSKYGYGFGLRAAEDHFAVCSEIALTAVREGWDDRRRSAHCFALLVGGITTPPVDAAVSPAIRELYRRQRSVLLPVARAALAAQGVRPGLDRDQSGDHDREPAQRWLDSVRCAGVQANANANANASEPGVLAGRLGHLACNRLGVRLGQEAVLRGLANLAARDLADVSVSRSTDRVERERELS